MSISSGSSTWMSPSAMWSSAKTNEKQAEASLSGALGAAYGGVTSAANTANGVAAQNATASQSLGQMAFGISQVQDAAAKTAATADTITPFMKTLQGYGDTMWNQGSSVYNQGQSVFGQGQDLLNLDGSGSGIAGRYASWLNSLNPNDKVSQAAADTQASFDNARGQMDRNLSRSGASVSSGNAMTAQQKWAQTLATTLAGVKTRARQLGLETQGTALKDALSAAQGLLATGSSISAQGASMQNSAGEMQSSAADIGTKAGALYASSGSLSASGAQLYATQAGGYSDLAKNLVSSGQLSVSAAKALSDAQITAAQYYSSQAEGYGQLAGAGTLLQSLFNS